MELVPLTADLAPPPATDANLFAPVPPANPVENTPGKTSPRPSLNSLLHLTIPPYEVVLSASQQKMPMEMK